MGLISRVSSRTYRKKNYIKMATNNSLSSNNSSNLNNTSSKKSSNPYKDSFLSNNMDHLTPEEQELWRLCYFAGLSLPSDVLKNVYDLCKFGCDPEHIVETVNTFCQSYYEKKESLKHSRNQKIKV